MEKINPKIKKYAVIALVTLGLFLLFGTSIRSCSQSKKTRELLQKYEMLEASRDSISKKHNKDLKSWEYSRSLYVADKEVLKDNLIKYSRTLDSVLKKHPKADAGFHIETVTKTDTVWSTDTVYQDSQNRPVYEYSIKDPYQEGKATAYPDSLRLKLMTKTGLIGVMEEGRLKITPTNKNVQITTMEGFQTPKPVVKSKFWKGMTIGVGIGAVATGAIILSR